MGPTLLMALSLHAARSQNPHGLQNLWWLRQQLLNFAQSGARTGSGSSGCTVMTVYFVVCAQHFLDARSDKPAFLRRRYRLLREQDLHTKSMLMTQACAGIASILTLAPGSIVDAGRKSSCSPCRHSRPEDWPPHGIAIRCPSSLAGRTR